jgi:hypothetical protein
VEGGSHEDHTQLWTVNCNGNVEQFGKRHNVNVLRHMQFGMEVELLTISLESSSRVAKFVAMK